MYIRVDTQIIFGKSTVFLVWMVTSALKQRYDASRRVGVELPWHPMEDRELEPAEVSSSCWIPISLGWGPQIPNFSHNHGSVESMTLKGNSSGPEVDPGTHWTTIVGGRVMINPIFTFFFSGYLSGPNPISKGSLVKGVKLLPSQGDHHFPYECLFNMKDTTAVVWLERALKQLKPWQWTTTILTIGKCDRHDDFLSQGLLQMPWRCVEVLKLSWFISTQTRCWESSKQLTEDLHNWIPQAFSTLFQLHVLGSS